MVEINKKISSKVYVFILAAFLAVAGNAFAWDGKCVGVADGDTITVMNKGKGERIRLHGIDTPEMGQDFGKRAKQFTSGMVFGKVVAIEQTDTDRYGRTVAIVYAGSKNVNEELIRSGFAWVFTKYCRERFCSYWKRLESEARQAGAGLWGHGNPIPPWKFRRNKSKSEALDDALRFAAGANHGNSKSHVFHRPGCRHYNCKNCTVIFQSREEAINAVYRPCKVCKP